MPLTVAFAIVPDVGEQEVFGVSEIEFAQLSFEGGVGGGGAAAPVTHILNVDVEGVEEP